jgi:glycosyltransferase involved in cell wall biosynthesis
MAPLQTHRVLVIAAAYPPSNSAGVHRTVRFVRYLPEFGWTPVVLTMEDPEGITAGETDAKAASLEHVAVHRTGRRRPEKNGSSGDNGGHAPSLKDTSSGKSRFTRPLRSAAANLKDLLLETPDRNVSWASASIRTALQLVQRLHPAAIYTTGPPHSTHLIGLRLKRRTGLPWIADFRDPWARKPWGFKDRNPWGQRLLGWYERRCVSAADRVILNTDHMTSEFRAHYRDVPADRFITVTNGWDPAVAELVHQAQETRAEGANRNGEADVIRLCHAGSLYRQRNPRPIIDALAILHRRGLRVRFEQIGSCDQSFQLSRYVREKGLEDWVSIEPPVSHEVALRRMAAADILTLVQPGTDLQVPGKLFEMLLYRKPIVALADAGATADIIQAYGLGAVASGDDPEMIACAIERAASVAGEIANSDGWSRALKDFDGRELTRALAGELDAAAAASSIGRVANASATAAFVESESRISVGR